jgi:hypothetical protein
LLPSPRGSYPRRLGLSVGRPGSHDFSLLAGTARQARPTRPRIPAPRVVTIAIRPLYRGGITGAKSHISEKRNRNIFHARTGHRTQR